MILLPLLLLLVMSMYMIPIVRVTVFITNSIVYFTSKIEINNVTNNNVTFSSANISFHITTYSYSIYILISSVNFNSFVYHVLN